jgi:hypothetical protein
VSSRGANVSKAKSNVSKAKFVDNSLTYFDLYDSMGFDAPLIFIFLKPSTLRFMRLTMLTFTPVFLIIADFSFKLLKTFANLLKAKSPFFREALI